MISRSLRAYLGAGIASSALVCFSLIANGQESAQQSTQPMPSGEASQSAATPSGDGAKPAELPQVEIVTKKDRPKPTKKKQAKKHAPSQNSTSAAQAQPTGQPTFDASSAQMPSGPGAAAIVTDYVATDSTVGTKTDTPLRETPQSVSVVGKEQMRDQGVQTLDQALRYMPGVQADPYGYDNRGDGAIIRGIPAAYFVDGMKVTNGYSVTTTPIEPYGAERVEVLRGPASMLYGQAPTGGIVNAVSKLPLDIPYNEIGVQYGSFDFKQTKFDFTGPMSTDGKWLYRLTGLARDADTQVDYVDNDRLFLAPSITYRPTNDTNITVLGNFRRDRSGSIQQFYPNIGTLTPNIDGKRVPINQFIGEPGDYNNTDQQSGTLLIDHKFNDSFRIHQGMRYSHTANETDTTYPALLTPARFVFLNNLLGSVGLPALDTSHSPFLNARQSEIARARTLSSADTTVFNSDSNFVARFGTGPLEHKVLGGFDYMRYSMTRESAGLLIDNVLTPSTEPFLAGIMPLQSVFNMYAPRYGQRTYFISADGPTPFAPAGDVRKFPLSAQLQQQAGLYVQDQITLGGWQAVLGLRQDWLSLAQQGSPTEHEEATTGRAALMYNFRSGLTPYVSYSTSFNPLPGQPVGDNIFTTIFDTRPAKPTRGEQIEAGIKYQPEGAPFIVSAAVYDLTDRNRIVQPDILFQAVQGADVNVRGFEIEAAGKLTRELKVIASYSYTDATYSKYPEIFAFNSGISEFMEGQRAEGIPKHLASLWAIYSFETGWMRGLSLGGGVRYVGSTESVGVDITNLQKISLSTPGYTLFDAMIAYETPDWRWDLTVQNLADKYTVSTCTVMRGDCFIGQARTILTGFTYKF